MLVNVWSFSGGALGCLWYCAIPVSFVMLTSLQYNFTCTRMCGYPGDKADKHHNPAKGSRSTSTRRVILYFSVHRCASAAVGLTLLWSYSD